MKNLFSTVLLVSAACLLGTLVAHAQKGRKAERIAAATATPAQPQTTEEAAREQQLRILEARAGNTSFGDGNGGAFRQLDKTSGGFTVRKFKAMPGQENKRGQGHQAPGIDPKGEPLKHKHKRNFFSS